MEKIKNPFDSENIYKNNDFNTEQPKPDVAESAETKQELQELAILVKDTELQLDNEMEELKKVIKQLPEEEKSELRKKIEKGFVIVSAAFMMFAATGCGQAGRQLDRGFGESVQRCFHDGLTERQQRSYEMEAKRIRDLRTRNINSKKMSIEEAERRYNADMQTLDAAYDSLRRK